MPTQHFRSDKGLILATPRDISMLTTMAHHGVVRYEHIRELLSLSPGGSVKNPGGELADTTVKDAINRWRRAGWVIYKRVLANERGYGYVTRKGLRLVGLDDIYDGQPPAELRWHHYWAVLDVRLHWWVEEEGEDDAVKEWIPERLLRVEMKNKKSDEKEKHPEHVPASVRIYSNGIIPDGVAVGDGWVDIIEVQLSKLSPKDMQLKLRRLSTATYYHVEHDKEYLFDDISFYVPSEALKRHIERARSHLDEKTQERIEIYVDPRYENYLPYVDESDNES